MIQDPKPSEKKSPPKKIFPFKHLGILLAIVLGSYFLAADGTFIWDDNFLIKQNEYIKDFSYLPRNLVTSFWNLSQLSERDMGQSHVYYRPLVTLSYMIDYHFHGINPRGYHLTNILLHLIATALIFSLLQKIFPSSPWPAFLITLLWALHPSRAEAVSWISGRTDVLMTIFAVLAWLAFWRATESSGHKRLKFIIGAWIAYVLGILCKESIIVLPFLLAIFDWFFISLEDRSRFWRQAKFFHLPLCLVTAIFIVWRLYYASTTVHLKYVYSFLPHVGLVLQTIGQYMMLVLWPYQPSMQIGAYYKIYNPSWPLVIVGAATILAWSIGLWLSLKWKNKLAAFALLFTAFSLAPVLNFKMLALNVIAAERFLYFPFLGVAILLGLATINVASKIKNKYIYLVPILLLVGSWLVVLQPRHLDFSDPQRYWAVELKRSPNNPLVQFFLAMSYAEKRKYNEAENLLFESFNNYAQRENNVSRTLFALLHVIQAHMLIAHDDDLDFPARVEDFLVKVLARAENPHRGPIMIVVGDKFMEVEIAGPEMQAAVNYHRDIIYSILSSTQSKLGKDVQAAQTLLLGLQIEPRKLPSLLNLILVYLRSEQIEKAGETYRYAMQVAPSSLQLQNLAEVMNKAEQRILDLRALRQQGLKPDDTQIQRKQAELYILTTAPRRARALLTDILKKEPGDRLAWTMLAMEWAKWGNLDQAKQVLTAARKQFPNETGLDHVQEQVLRAYDNWRQQNDQSFAN